jgi:hypothetical protein
MNDYRCVTSIRSVETAELAKFLPYAVVLHRRMSLDRKSSPVALTIAGVISNYTAPSPQKPGRRGRMLARRASAHPVRDILLGVAGAALGGLWMSGWNPIGGRGRRHRLRHQSTLLRRG